jgi:lipopolysaccharide/colanic/teichoic acid biosynthesis glycosyltransferase
MNATSSPTGAKTSTGLHILLLDPCFRRANQAGDTRTYDIARRLTLAGHHVRILTTSAALGNDVADGLEITVIARTVPGRFGYSPHGAHEAFARNLTWHLWQLKDVDAILTTDRPLAIVPMLVAFCTWRAVPLLIDVREGPPAPAPRTARVGERFSTAWARGLYRLASHAAQKIAVLSPEMEKDLIAQRIGGTHMDADKLVLSAPGCDTALFANQPGSSAPALTAYPHLAQGPLVAYAGVMDDSRDLLRLLTLAQAVQSLAPNVAFALCGDGPARGRLEAKALEYGILNKNVWFLDSMPRCELHALLGAASAVFVAKSSGGAGLFYDALAAGRPVIVPDHGWQRELIEGRSGGIGLPEDTQHAARELIDFVTDADGLRRASQQAAALAASRFNIDRVMAKMRDAIQESVEAAPRHAVLRRRTLRAKRAFDLIVGTSALLVLSPLLIAIAIAVRWQMGGPVLFTQVRPGFKGKPFKIYKFRSMTSARDASGALLPDGARLTSFGKLLRRTSIDELPQLINVIKGEMSIVGPRPLLPEYMPYYTAEQHRRHDVKPGLTGWAVVNGRNSSTWEEKFARDVYYADNVSLAFDIKIILMTAWVLVSGKGVSAEGHATFERFDDIMARRQGAEDV